MDSTPKANRIHLGFFGKCNAGKSTLINMLTGQDMALVSDVPGTTTDPVMKAMEILPLGPVLIIDTAGVDDTSALGPLRIEKTKEIVNKVHIAVYVLKTNEEVSEEDFLWLAKLQEAKIPTLLMFNEVVGFPNGQSYIDTHEQLKNLDIPWLSSNIISDADRATILNELGKMKPADTEEVTLLEEIINPGDIVILVCPIDSAAPKGRLILPQVQMIREILDHRALSLVCQVEEIPQLLQSLKEPPALVITDSQAFKEVAELVPESIPLTSFSILMARFKGDLTTLVAGQKALQNLKKGAKVLISEGCTHHRQCDDIGTVKIPKWLAKAGYQDLQLSWTSGGAFPDTIKEYDLVIHCGACMLTRKEVLRRIEATIVDGVPIINYGVLIASLHGILERALSPFIDELK